MLFNSCVRACL